MDVYAREGYVINLGRAGESNARTILFDVSTWADLTQTDSIFTLWYAPIGETFGTIPIFSQPYSSGAIISWLVGSEITTLSRAGRCQLTQTVGQDTPNTIDEATGNSMIRISEFYDTIVTESFRSSDGSVAGQLHEDWLNAMDVAIAKMQYLTANAQPVSYNENIAVAVTKNIKGSYDLTFKIPEAPPFEITANYDTIDSMIADKDNLAAYDFVIIAGDTQLEDSGKLYMRRAVDDLSKEEEVDKYFMYCSDLSGMQGPQGIGITNARIDSEGHIYLTYTDPFTSTVQEVEIPGSNFYQAIFAVQTNVESAKSLAQQWAIGDDSTSAQPSSENNAKYFAEQSGAAKEAAETAQSAAETAQANAEEAQTAAETAQAAAETAQTAAETAQNRAETAQASAETAQNLSQQWAVGNGSSSETPSTVNNAKYFANQASTSADNASTAQGAAESAMASAGTFSEQAEASARLAQQWATGGSADEEPSSENNAKYYSQQAQNYAENIEDNIDLSKYWAEGNLDNNGQEISDGGEYYHKNSRYNAKISEYWAEGHLDSSGVEINDGDETGASPYYRNNAKYNSNLSRYWAEGHQQVQPDGSTVEIPDSDVFGGNAAPYYARNSQYYAKFLSNVKVDVQRRNYNENPTVIASSSAYEVGETPFIPGGNPNERLKLTIGVPDGAPGKIWKPTVDSDGYISWMLLDPNASGSGAETPPDTTSIQGPPIQLSKPDAVIDAQSLPQPTVDVSVTNDSTDASGLTKKLTFSFSGLKGEKGDVGSVSIQKMVESADLLPDPEEKDIPPGTMYGVEGNPPDVYVCSENNNDPPQREWYNHGPIAGIDKVVFGYYHDGIFYKNRTTIDGAYNYTNPISPAAEVLYINYEDSVAYYYNTTYKKLEDATLVHALITSVQDGQYLKYDATAGTFVNTNLPIGSTTAPGLLQTDGSIPVADGIISMPKASASVLGGIKIGNHIDIDLATNIASVNQIKLGTWVNDNVFRDLNGNNYTGAVEVLYLDTTTNVLYYWKNNTYIAISKKQVNDGYLYQGVFYATKIGDNYSDIIKAESNKLYIDIPTNYIYRYSTSSNTYILLSKSYVRIGYYVTTSPYNGFYKTRSGSAGSYTYSDKYKEETDVLYIDISTNNLYRYSIISTGYILLTPQPDWNQANAAARDFIKNKPVVLNEEDIVDILSEYITIDTTSHTLALAF